MTLSNPRRLALPAMLLGLSLVSACDKPGLTPLPPAADVQAATEAKPLPHAEAVFDDKVKASDDAALESWGERLQAAGKRVCRWLNANGGKYDCGD